MSWHLWITFLAASFAISLSPGAGAVASMDAGLRHGTRASLPLVAGLVLGISTQVLVVGMGLGALIATSALAFHAVQVVGVLYLIGLGVQQWRAPATALVVVEDEAAEAVETAEAEGTAAVVPVVGAAASIGGVMRSSRSMPGETSTWRLLRRGWMVNGLNPKGTVFLLAVVPQFLQLGAPLAPQYLAIGATLAFTDACVMTGYAALAARVLRHLRSTRQVRWVQRCFGVLFIAAGLLLASFRRV